VKAFVTSVSARASPGCPTTLRLVRRRRSAQQISKGNDPIVLGKSVNTLTTYGYDPARACRNRRQRSVRSERREGITDHGSRQVLLMPIVCIGAMPA